MKIIKRSGEEVGFDITKIIAAVHKANKEVELAKRLTTEQIQTIAQNIEEICKKAQKLYLSVTKYHSYLENRCAKFKELEKKSLEYF